MKCRTEAPCPQVPHRIQTSKQLVSIESKGNEEYAAPQAGEGKLGEFGEA